MNIRLRSFSLLFFSLLFFTLLFWGCKTSTERIQSSKEVYSLNTDITSFDDWLENPIPLISAHRGGPYPGYPENAIETFQNIVDHTNATVVIECDVSMTLDSILILMHDETLTRTSEGDGAVRSKTWEEINKLRLLDNQGQLTEFEIPTLNDALTWGKNKVLFTLDVKRGVPFELVMEQISATEAAAYSAIITYNIDHAKLVHSLKPDIHISVSAGDDGALEQIEKSQIPSNKLLGFVGTSEPEPAHYTKLKRAGIKTILGTLGNLDKRAIARGNDDQYLEYIQNGADIIATDRPLEVLKILKRLTAPE